ncbi:MAG: Xaa-Pro peptidase family protein [Paracoccaceae bacterium]|jgi:Xaa-Pro aminopeptidase|nr:Xaa-Pro peptidase family protein [Paracoccaceae bacterium]
MPAPSLGFDQDEYEKRTTLLQAYMARTDVAAALFTTEAELRYFTGFRTLFWQSPTRPWFLFIPQNGKPIAVIPEIGAALMRQTWIDDIRTWSAPTPTDDGISLLVELMAPLAQTRKKLGLLKGHETFLRMPLGDYERLIDLLAGLEVCDITPQIRAQRMVKSSSEIEKIAHICTIASDSFAAMGRLAFVDQGFDDTFRAFRKECLTQGADDVPYLVGGADQDGYIDVISPPSRRPLQKGDIVMLDTGATFDGYFCDFDRNFAMGKADDHSKLAYDVLWRATQAGLNAAVPGARACDLFHAMQKVITKLDNAGGDVGRLGHGLGMQLTEWPSHCAWDKTELQEGMVLTLEPSLSYGAGKIMVHEENIVIENGGARLLSRRAAPELPIL